MGDGFCHRNTRTCWGHDRSLGALERRLAARLADGPDSSFTARLARDPQLLAKKLVEEAHELGVASDRENVVWESADLMYFTAAAIASRGVSLAEVTAELDRRALQTRRRDGSKTFGVGEE
jgi:phosphoribosyl-ATP pyrophosphohydrolase/phosphoribosyl-AMP cyclohydrolase/histidinol dehydrogenase